MVLETSYVSGRPDWLAEPSYTQIVCLSATKLVNKQYLENK